jgi:N-acetylated-alpha-linked acidic dipeptidase
LAYPDRRTTAGIPTNLFDRIHRAEKLILPLYHRIVSGGFMRARCVGIQVTSLIVVVASALAQGLQMRLSGFTVPHSDRERAIEKQFMGVPDAAKAEANHKVITVEPHLAGSPADHRNAEFVLQQFRSFGLDAEIEEFPVLLSEPKEMKLDVLEPIKFSGPNPENVPEDPASKDPRATVGFNAYSASGEVTAQVVYANYGLPEDYDLLRAKGVSPDGKIVIVRYGECYRGVKALVAEEHKAAALIIYSDPNDDGYHAGEAYPKGPWRPASGVQRGSVLYDFIYPGTLPDKSTVPHIPIMPLSYEDARHILEQLSGGVAPQTWQGGLPFTYHYGPGPAKVKMRVEMNEITRPVWNVIAKIRGSGEPEELVVLGNHRDAWVFGGLDPNSGTVAMLEVARGLGTLLRGGWRPLRTIILCSWDAEEQGELGSTHWAEKYAGELSEKAAAYLNLDSAVAGDRFTAQAVPSLKKFVKEVATDIPDPKGGSVWDHTNQLFREHLRPEVRFGHVPVSGPASKAIKDQEAEVGDLVSGTDYVAFLDHMGIPSTDFTFDGDYGVYHSIFDNHQWMKEFGDPTFRYHVAAAQLYGLEALRLAEADVLPFDYETYGLEIQNHFGGIANRLALLGQTSQLDLQTARKAAEGLAQAGKEVNARCNSLLSREGSTQDLYSLNRALVKAEKDFLLTTGLPRRPWFKHSVFAPGFYNGYEAVPLAGVVESVDAGNFEEARRQLQAVTDAIARATNTLKAAASDRAN